MRYKSVIFDLDGVITHTDKYHYQAWKQLADKLGIFFDLTVNNRLRGVSRMESLEIILEGWKGYPFSAEEKEQMAKEKNEIYKELLQKMTPEDLDNDVKVTLEELRSHGYKLAIGSSSKNARLILSRIGLGDYFDAISDGNNISNSKPHPEVFLKAAEFVDMAPGDCVVVEDAKAGIDAAYAAGMDSAAIGDARLNSKATYRLSAFSDLKMILC
jgi:beta-phosphoglucomutase